MERNGDPLDGGTYGLADFDYGPVCFDDYLTDATVEAVNIAHALCAPDWCITCQCRAKDGTCAACVREQEIDARVSR